MPSSSRRAVIAMLTVAVAVAGCTSTPQALFIDPYEQERFILEGAPHLATGTPVPARLRHVMDTKGKDNVDCHDPLAWTLPQALQVIAWLTGRSSQEKQS
jgi:hypothetical protein